jgi:hypothetical protein
MLARAYGFAGGAVLALAAAGLALAAEPQASLSKPWEGGDRIVVAVGADVRYVQGPVARVTATGPRAALDELSIHDSVIGSRLDGWSWWGWGWERFRDVHIVVTAPRLSSGVVSGPGRLDLGRLEQDKLNLVVSGPGRVTAQGAVRTVDIVVTGPGRVQLDGLNAGVMKVVMSGPGGVTASGVDETVKLVSTGPGHIDLSGLKLQDAEIAIMGPGGVRVAPTRSARVHITGPGWVQLLTNPASLDTSVTGPGRVIRGAD